MSMTVQDNPQESRYEIRDGTTVAGFVDYKIKPGQIALLHTEVDQEFSGQGVAQQLVTGVLDAARQRELAVLPFCPYVAKFIAKDRQYLDLVRPGDRGRFGLDEDPVS